MKKLLVVLVLMSVLAWSAVCQAGSTEIVNGLEGMQITEIYLSRASTSDWEEDILGDEILEPGESVTVEFHPAENECEWDMLAKDEAGTQVEWHGLDLCGVGRITLQPGGTAVLE